MTTYEEMGVLAKQIREIHKTISKLYHTMSTRNEEYFWQAIERQVESEKEKVALLRAKHKDATYRFVNWQPGSQT